MNRRVLALAFALTEAFNPICLALRHSHTNLHKHSSLYNTFGGRFASKYTTMADQKPKGDGCGGMGITHLPKSEHKYTLIWMHGLGDTADGWKDIISQFTAMDDKFHHLKFILPTAEVRPVSLNMGMPMPAWFDIKSLEMGGEEDSEGMIHAVKRIRNIINAEEEAGIKPENIYIGGFSQGGAVAYLTALMTTQAYGGVIGCSSWLPLIAHKKDGHNPNITKIPVLHCHGEDDQMVQFTYGKASAEFLKSELKMQVQFKSYADLEHSACLQELQDIAAFLISRMS